jgi:hypothetical protein
MPVLSPLAAAAAVLAVLAVAPAALAAPASRTYDISVRGDQVTTWSYSGDTPGNCGGTQKGSGRQAFTFRSAPRRVVAVRGAARAWSIAATLPIQADGSRTGSFVTSPSRCQTEPVESPADDCGDAQWTFDGMLGYGLGAYAGRLTLSTSLGLREDGRALFVECPFFEGPSDNTYLAQEGDLGRGIGASADAVAGLRFGFQRLAQRRLAAGRTFEVPRETIEAYEYRDRWGHLSGRTVLRWTVTFRRPRH